jgi:magnesium and cobalt exporter, CNNM family
VDVAVNLVLVLVFVLVGGFFAAAEIALVTLRPGQVRELAGRGRRGRRVARLREDSSRFLSAVQIGVMVPRTEVDFLEAGQTLGEATTVVMNQPHSGYPVLGDTVDDVVGVVHIRDLLTAAHAVIARAGRGLRRRRAAAPR